MTYADLEAQIERLRRQLAELIYRARGNMLDPDVQNAGAALNELILTQMRLGQAAPPDREHPEL